MPAVAQKITTQEKLDWRKPQLRMLVDREDSSLDAFQQNELHNLLLEYHQTLVLKRMREARLTLFSLSLIQEMLHLRGSQ